MYSDTKLAKSTGTHTIQPQNRSAIICMPVAKVLYFILAFLKF
jgi:hypothetical protein